MELTDEQKLDFRQAIFDYAKSLGFDLVGFSKAKIDDKYLKVFSEWLNQGYEADMSYVRKISARADVDKVLPGAKTVIVFGMNYYQAQPPLKRGHGRIARYAYGRDYHKVIGKKLRKLEKFINQLLPDFIPGNESASPHSLDVTYAQAKSARADLSLCADRQGIHQARSTKCARAHFLSQKTAYSSQSRITKSCVDTGPILERAFAEQAGLGRIGKNGCLITEKFGSWIFIGEIITTLDLIPFPGTESSSRWSDPSQKPFNICGNCARCIISCPTGAIITPGIINSNLCISYLTIENRKKITPSLVKIIKKTKRIFGCDICQEVCPHNTARANAQKNRARSASKLNRQSAKSSPNDLLNGLLAPIAGDSLNLKKISSLRTDSKFLTLFAGSSLMRAKRKGLQRNTKILRSAKKRCNTRKRGALDRAVLYGEQGATKLTKSYGVFQRFPYYEPPRRRNNSLRDKRLLGDPRSRRAHAIHLGRSIVNSRKVIVDTRNSIIKRHICRQTGSTSALRSTSGKRFKSFILQCFY